MEINKEYFIVGAVLIGLSFISGIGWSIYGIIMHKKEQLVTGVCLTGLCLVGETWLFLTYMFWSFENRELNFTTIDIQQKCNNPANNFIGLIYEGDTVHVVTDPNTPPKIVIFECHS